MEDYSQYDRTENDPYLISGSTCLVNCLGLTDTPSLNTAEEQFSTVRLAGLKHSPVTPTFDLIHLQHIHERLFGDVYFFAGKIRTVEISKGGNFFLPYRLVEAEAQRCFAQLHEQHLLTRLDAAEFGSEAGFFLGWINKIHAFREGNGRAQRILIDQLALLNGYAIEWAAMSKAAMVEACREARITDDSCARLRKLIALNTVKVESAS